MKPPRHLRILLSCAVLATFAYAFAIGAAPGNIEKLSGFFKLQFGPSLLRIAADYSRADKAALFADTATKFYKLS